MTVVLGSAKHWISAFLFLALCVGVHAQDIVSGVSQDIIQINSSYAGTDIVVFGAIGQATGAEPHGIVVVVRGPDISMTVRRRDRIAGIWVNSDAARFEGLPAYYYLASTEPINQIAAKAELIRYGIGIENLRPSAVGSHHDPNPFLRAALRQLEKAGLYSESPGSIDFLSNTLFRTRVPLPAGAARGQYNVEVYLFRKGDVVSAQSTPLFVDQTGLERRLFNMAHNAPLTYGLLAVMMAMVLGWISSVLFRRPT